MYRVFPVTLVLGLRVLLVALYAGLLSQHVCPVYTVFIVHSTACALHPHLLFRTLSPRVYVGFFRSPTL